MSEIEEALLRAAAETLRPLVARLLDAGVPFGRLERRLRRLFVEVAERCLAESGDEVTDSRVSLLTGINRKETRRLRRDDSPSAEPKTFSKSVAANLVRSWTLGRDTRGGREGPRPLPFRSRRGPSFVKLARQTTQALRPKAILDELLRTGAVELRADGMIVLETDAYVPALGTVEKLEMLAEDPAELVETMLGNAFGESEPRLQRKIYYDDVGADGLPRLRREVRREAERFIDRMNRRLSAHDRDVNPDAAGGERHYVSLGVYYYDEPRDRPRIDDRPRPRRVRPKESE